MTTLLCVLGVCVALLEIGSNIVHAIDRNTKAIREGKERL